MKLPEDPKDIKVLREFLTTVRQQICGMGDCLAEPWKTHFNNLQNEYGIFKTRSNMPIDASRRHGQTPHPGL